MKNKWLSFRKVSFILSVIGLCLFAASLNRLHRLAMESLRAEAKRSLASDDHYAKLIQITTDFISGTFEVGINENVSNAVDTVIFKGMGPDMSWNVNQLRTGIDVPLDTDLGDFKGLVSFRSSDFDPNAGGHVVMTFPHDIIAHSELTRTMIVSRAPDGSWQCIGDAQMGNKQFHSIRLTAHKDLLVPTGIESVTVVK